MAEAMLSHTIHRSLPTCAAPVVDAQAGAALEALETEAAVAGGAAQQVVLVAVAPHAPRDALDACRHREMWVGTPHECGGRKRTAASCRAGRALLGGCLQSRHADTKQWQVGRAGGSSYLAQQVGPVRCRPGTGWGWPLRRALGLGALAQTAADPACAAAALLVAGPAASGRAALAPPRGHTAAAPAVPPAPLPALPHPVAPPRRCAHPTRHR